ncbi:MAG: superoxide dismutase [Candidatus Doudnabacteria bacterium]|nr:superoxide dismutase [Candidatus Doudnabacteria bacterium]
MNKNIPAKGGSASGGKHILPPLPYAYDALEPYIDARTMELHHTKHHQTYVDKLNGVLEKYPKLADMPLEEIMRKLDSLPIETADRAAIKNHGGGHLNHSLFWQIMGPASPSQGGPKKATDEKLIEEITKTCGSLEEFKKKFSETAAARFGSGWAWLARKANGQLEIYSTQNQDSPYLTNDTPIIGLDVWEHAYYLKYQNKRPDYIEAWWNVLKLLP